MKDDPSKTGKQLIKELEALRSRIASMERTAGELEREKASVQESAERYRDLLANARDVIYTVSENGIISSLSPAFQKLSGWSSEECIGKPLQSLIHPDDWPFYLEILHQLSQGETPEAFELRFLARSGDYRTGECRMIPQTGDGKIKEAMGVFRDFTDHKKAEEALRRSEEKHRLYFENVSDVIYSISSDLIVLSVSPSVEHLLGYRPEELIGKRVEELDIISPLSLDCAFADIRRVLAGERIQSAEYEFLTKEGMTRVGEVSGAPIYSEGKVVALLSVARDVTDRKKVETALRRSEETHRLYIENVSDVIYSISSDLILLSVSPSVERLLGYRPEEVIGKRMDTLSLIAPQSLGVAFIDTRRVLAGERIQSAEYEFLTKEGMTRVGEVSAGPIYSEGKVVALLAVARDVTDRKKVETALRESEERFRRLTENVQDIIYRYEFSPKQGFSYISPAAESITGYSPQEFYADPDHFFKIVHSADRPLLEALVRREIPVRTPLVLRYNRRDGGTVWIEQRNSPVYDEEGNLVALEGIARDVTESKITQDARWQSEMRYHSVVEQSADGIFLMEVYTKRILEANTAFIRMLGYPSQEIRGLSLHDFVVGEQEGIDQRYQKILQEEEPLAYEESYRRKDGSRMEVWTNSRVISFGGERVMCTIVHDLTEKKALEAQILRAQRMESIAMLSGGIAHDLNNILTPILINTELLSQKIENDLNLRLLSSIATSAQRGADIVRQVMAFSGKIEREHAFVSPQYLLKEVRRFALETFPKSITIMTDAPADLWPLFGDATQLYQAVLNLCLNARDAMPHGGVLNLSAHNTFLDEIYSQMYPEAHVGSYIVLTISDTGLGIPETTLEKMFDPFFTTKEPGEGLGLGLPTAHGIVKSHGGFIQVYSEIGKGTRFQIYLPASPLPEKTLPEEGPSFVPSGEGALILIVEDEESVRDTAQMTLESFGYRVITASDGAEAVSLYAQHQEEVRAVLTDMIMPIMAGPVTIKALRKINPAVKIIATSGQISNEMIAEVKDAEIDAFLEKPFTAQKLLKILDGVLKGEVEG